MKTFRNTLFLAAILLFFSADLFAQPTALPYKNGFDGVTTDWNFVSDIHNPANNWIVGTAVRRSLTKSLYVSDDGTRANYDDSQSSTIFAYKELTLPEFHSYSIYFDWRSKGGPGDSLYVCWVTDNTPIAPALDGSLPAWVNATKKLVLGGIQFGDESAWTDASFSVCGTGQPAKLVFVWRNDGHGTTHIITTPQIASPAGSIDNLQINQNLDLNYKTSFNNPAEAGWTFQTRAGVPNKWCIGSANYLSPGGALYISNDNGATHEYDASIRNFCSAIKEVTLPKGEQFTVDFDWMSGVPNAAIRFGYYTDSTRLNSTFSNTNAPPTLANIPGIELKNSTIWQHHTETFAGTGKPERLYFMWYNDQNTHTTSAAGIIDNLTIRKTDSDCRRPTTPTAAIIKNLNGSVIGIEVKWASPDTCNLSYTYLKPECGDEDRRGEFITKRNVTSPDTIKNINRGYYSIFIDAVCQNSFEYCDANGGTVLKIDSATQTIHGVMSVINQGCIDFTNLAAANPHYARGWTSPPSFGLVDFGYQNWLSRHTVHTVPEYDTITLGGLRTVPDCEFVSVRLGNKGNMSEWEGVEYNITVDKDYALLILKYAIVLEEPGHSEEPKFTLEVLQNNNIINPTCGKAEFIANPSMLDDTWTIIPSGQVRVPGTNVATTSSSPAGRIFWKDWTTVGINLRHPVDLRGQTIKVRIRNYDCNASGHFGYSYFTLDCAKAGLEGLSCGNNTIELIEAPQGFTYCWYKKFNTNGTIHVYDPNNPDCLTTERTYHPPPADTATYICRVTSIANPACFFELVAKLKPRWPKSDVEYVQMPANCQNIVKLKNHSHLEYDDSKIVEDEIPETYYWLLTDQQSGDTVFEHSVEVDKESFPPPSPPDFIAPNEGGTYNLLLISGVNSCKCTDTLRMVLNISDILNIPSIVIPAPDTIELKICSLPHTYFGKTYNTAGYHQDTIFGSLNAVGCDIVQTLNLVVVDTLYGGDTVIICEKELPYRWNSVPYNAAGDYNKSFVSSLGCDSIATLHLVVNSPSDTTHINATICDGEWYDENGFYRGVAGDYYLNKTNIHNCDSVIHLNLTVNSKIDVSLDPVPNDICQIDPNFIISYRNNNGNGALPTHYIITFNDLEFGNNGVLEIQSDGTENIVIPIPNGIIPNKYSATVKFVDNVHNCPADNEKPFEFTIMYPAEYIIEQKWNNVLAVHNINFNDGYDFIDYQWFEDDNPISRGSYLYLGENISFPYDANGVSTKSYHVELTRRGETLEIGTCPPFYPTYRAPLQQYPTIGNGNIHIEAKKGGTITFMHVSGIVVSRQNLSEGINSIQIPPQQGFYIMVVEERGQLPTNQIFIVR